jgi:hypothetical protein
MERALVDASNLALGSTNSDRTLQVIGDVVPTLRGCLSPSCLSPFLRFSV